MEYVIFGESHGPAIGVTLSGVPAGLSLDLAALQAQLDRRAPGRDDTATPRREADTAHVISGLFEGKTTGAPLTIVIQNSDQHSGDYDALRYTPRPSHGDYPGFVASQGCQDHRGGGHFSGRLTAPLVAAGAVARQLLAERGVTVEANIALIGGEAPVGDGENLRAVILEAKKQGDSVGGAIACAISGLPAGLGAPDFGQNAEGILAQHLFAIPAVKAVEFGAGVAFAYMRGTEANDPLTVQDGQIVPESNNAGGINGGITNGAPLEFTVTLRPTPSIALPQKTVDLRTGEEVEIEIKGRHDPCIVPRAVPVVEAAAALAACRLLGI